MLEIRNKYKTGVGQEVWMDRAVSYIGFVYMGGRIILICMKF